MSMQACQAAGLSATVIQQCQALPSFNWSSIAAIIQDAGKYAPQVIQVIETLAPLLASGVSWATVEQAVLSLLAILKAANP